MLANIVAIAYPGSIKGSLIEYWQSFIGTIAGLSYCCSAFDGSPKAALYTGGAVWNPQHSSGPCRDGKMILHDIAQKHDIQKHD